MKKLDKRIKKGTKVLVESAKGWQTVKEIIGVSWFKIDGYAGTWQAGHILKFSNRGIK